MIIYYTVPEIRYMADVIVIFLFWAIFWPFTLLTVQKIKISKNGKNPGDIIILHEYQNL